MDTGIRMSDGFKSVVFDFVTGETTETERPFTKAELDEQAKIESDFAKAEADKAAARASALAKLADLGLTAEEIAAL
jgi:hypothetical protein